MIVFLVVIVNVIQYTKRSSMKHNITVWQIKPCPFIRSVADDQESVFQLVISLVGISDLSFILCFDTVG